MKPDCIFGLDDAALRKRYVDLSGGPWPLDWTAEEKHWTTVAEAFFRSRVALDPAGPWKELAARDKANAAFYAAAYLGVLRVKAGAPDTALINQFVTAARDVKGHEHAERIARLALSLAAVEGREIRATAFVQPRLCERLEFELSAIDGAELLRAVPELADTYQRVGDATSGRLLQAVLQRTETLPFQRLCTHAKIRPAAMYEHFAAKRCRIEAASYTPGELLSILQQQVVVPLWLDDSLKTDERQIRFAADGVWIDVVTKAAAEVDCEVVLLADWIVWVGKPQNRAAAETLLSQSRAKIVGEDGGALFTGKALRAPSSCEFVDTPLQDIYDYFRDVQHFPILSAGGATDTPISFSAQQLPLHLLLTLLAKEHGLDWQMAYGTVVIDRAEAIDAFRQLADDQRLARLRRSTRTDKVAKSLGQSTTLEFIETPLIDVAAYLMDLHDVSIVVDRGLTGDSPITHCLSGIDLAWALSLLCFQHKIAWCDDGDAIYLCRQERLDALRALRRDLEERRKNYPKAWGEKLRQPAIREFNDTLETAIAELMKQTGVAIEVDESGPVGGGIVSRELGGVPVKLPLDLHLMLVAEELGIEWIVRGEKILIREKSPMQNE